MKPIIIFNSRLKKVKQDVLFLDIMINKSGTKIWVDNYNKTTGPKRYVPFTLNNPQHCLMNIEFSLARRICNIVENENVKEKRFKELERTLLEQKYPKSRTESSILRAKEIPLEILRQPRIAKNDEILRFTFTCNSNNSNVFPIIKQSLDNFQYSKAMPNIF